MKTFPLTIVSDSEIIFSGQVRYCGIISVSGSLGFEADHEPYMGILRKKSEITIIDGVSKESVVKVESGLFLFSKNSCTVTVQLLSK